jgi:hypothetical protein
LAAFLLIDGNYNAVIWFTCILFLLSLGPMYLVSKRLGYGASHSV